jgi:prepilin-type N-terminal cleavage/methylation domain-containing protein
MKSMKHQQSGFTLVEIAIVLVIIGLLLGGILKGQELINSAKVKNLANDFKTVPLYIYGYQDRFKALPGDDLRVVTNITGATLATTGGTVGNGVIEGNWNSATLSDESALFWQHVRLANFAAGPTLTTDPNYLPTNVEGGRTGISSNILVATGGLAVNGPVAGMTGTYAFCSANLLGKFAKQLDVTLDDGNTATGSVRTIPNNSAPAATALANAAIDDATSYTVCMAF